MNLSLRGVTRSFAGQTALAKVELRVENARALVLVGPSGGGKSTLLRIVGGLETVDSGVVEIDGRPLPKSEAGLREHRRRIGTVFQAFNLFPHLSALANLTLPLEKVHGFAPAQAREIARSHLARFRLEVHADKKPAALSGGQRQRVAIARALSIEPRLLLFDEPTSALDPEMTAEVLDAIEELRNEGRDLVVVTHHMAFARRVADQAVFLAEGRVIESGNAASFFSEPSQPQTRAFLAKILEY